MRAPGRSAPGPVDAYAHRAGPGQSASSGTERSARRRFGATLLAAALVLAMSAHVGSRNVFFRGQAGPYPLSVIIRAPEVVPGLADVSIRIAADDVERVTVQPTRWDAAPDAGAPPPDEAPPVPGDPELYSADLWLMTGGTYRVTVAVEGARGPGSVDVPITSVPSNVLGMPAGLGWILLALGSFLFVGVVSILGTAARESVLHSGEVISPRDRRRGLIAMGVGTVFVALLTYGGKAWWDSVDADARSGIFQPIAVEGRVAGDGGVPALDLTITDPQWLGRGWSPILPDHGKLMHAFVVAETGGAFAHIHPVPVDSATFRAVWPDLPAGTYRVYGDVVHESGFAQTMVDTIVVSTGALSGAGVPPGEPSIADPGIASPPPRAPDPDDSRWIGRPVGLRDGVERTEFPFEDGSTLIWHHGAGPMVVDEDLALRFELRNPGGDPAELEPYMGMLGHAAVSRNDGAVFVHLHPAGTISMGSLSILQRRAEGDTTLRRSLTPDTTDSYRWTRPDLADRLMSSMPRASGEPGVVAFPFGFPRDGEYTIWVQVKRAGEVLTGAFRATVHAS